MNPTSRPVAHPVRQSHHVAALLTALCLFVVG
jgi:hypothetical protein